ncbi:hypothetical protein ACFQ3Z_22910 [Streptomyces nogalater]
MFAFTGSDLTEANALFRKLVRLRRARSSVIKTVLGRKDMWHGGPSADWPWVVLIVDEAHTFVRDHKGSDKESKQLAALAAKNARGDDIRLWPDANPTVLQEPAYVGVAVMKTQGQKGFTRVRTPYVSEADSAGIAARTAHLTAAPADLLAAQLPGIDLMKDDSDDDAIPPLAA